MKKMIEILKKKKYYIASFLALCMIAFTFGIYSNSKKIDNTSFKNNIESKGISMMLETEVNSGIYKTVSTSEWPTEGYVFNGELSKCENGGTLEWDDELKIVKFKGNVSDKCYVYFDIQPPDIYVYASDMSATYGKVGSVSCDNSTSNYNAQYNRIEISSINNEYESCVLSFSDVTSKNYLNNYVTNLKGTTQGDGKVVGESVTAAKYDSSTNMQQSSYTNRSFFTSSSKTSTSGTTLSGMYTYSNGMWTFSVNDYSSDNSYYHFKFTPSGTNTSGSYYQMCFNLSEGSSLNSISIYVGTQEKIIISSSTSESKSYCYDLGSISSGTYIKITNRIRNEENVSTFSFSIKEYSSLYTYDGGIRYEGKSPNNYVWYNNELWRIIGVFDSDSHGVANKSLVKIIKANSIGGYSWDINEKNDWSTASLNKLLNNYYLNAEDGTNSDYCYCSNIKCNCDFTKKGIQDGYREMIENVTWYLGGIPYENLYVNDVFGYERSDTTHKDNAIITTGYIGLMYASDYGYSVLSTDCARTTYMDSYSTNSCADKSWLYGQSYEEAEIAHRADSNTKIYYLGGDGVSVASASSAYVLSFSVRPTLYLKSEVFVKSGDGTASSPYILGM